MNIAYRDQGLRSGIVLQSLSMNEPSDGLYKLANAICCTRDLAQGFFRALLELRMYTNLHIMLIVMTMSAGGLLFSAFHLF